MTAGRTSRRLGILWWVCALTLQCALALPLSADPIDRATLERGMVHASRRIPELREAFRLAEKEGVELFLYGGTSRGLGFYVKQKLQQQGTSFFTETTPIPLEEVVGPYSDLDLIVRGPGEKSSRMEQALRSQFPEGERFYRWEIRTEDFLKEPWQITQGYEPVSKVLLGKDGFLDPDWRRAAFGKSLTEQGVSEIVSGELSYFRNPRYTESEPYRRGEHHELLEAIRYVRFLHEFEDARPDHASLQAVRDILEEAKRSAQLTGFLRNELFRRRFETNLQKLQYSSLDNRKLAEAMREIGLAEVLRNVGYEKELRVPLARGNEPTGVAGDRLREPLVVYHGTSGYREAWSIARGGPYVTTRSNPTGFFVSTNPAYAQGYAKDSAKDFILQLTLSPEARWESDVVRVDPEVLVVRTGEAIQKIERPLTAIEVKGRLFGALALPVGPERAQNVQQYMEQLAQRAQQGSRDALRALIDAPFPTDFVPFREELLARIAVSNQLPPEHPVWSDRLEKIPDAVLTGLLRRTIETGPPQMEAQLLLTLGRRVTSLDHPRDETVRDFFDQVLRLINSRGRHDSKAAFLLLADLADNKTLHRWSPAMLDGLFQTTMDVRSRTWRDSLLSKLAENPSLASLPKGFSIGLMNTARESLSHAGATSVFVGFASNPALPKLPKEIAAGVREELEQKKLFGGSRRKLISIALASNPSVDQLDSELLKQLSTRTLGVRKNPLLPDVTFSLARNPRAAWLPPRLLGELLDDARLAFSSSQYGTLLRDFALNSSFPKFPREFIDNFFAKTQELSRPERRHVLFQFSVLQPLQELSASALERYIQVVAERLEPEDRKEIHLALRRNRTLSELWNDPVDVEQWLRTLAAARAKTDAQEATARSANETQGEVTGTQRVKHDQGDRKEVDSHSLRTSAQRELRSFGKGMGIWMGALAVSDVVKSVGSGRFREIPGQLASMAHPQSLGALGLNYGSFSAAARAVEQPMLWMASKGSAQAFKTLSRFAGPVGFFAGSAVADLVSTGQLDLERWLVSGFGFLGTHALLNATVAPLIITGLGLSSTGIGATVGVPILILAGSMLGAAAIERGYYWLKDYLKRRRGLRQEHELTDNPSGSTNGTTPASVQGGGGISGALDEAERAMHAEGQPR